jgi:hypothetical protein
MIEISAIRYSSWDILIGTVVHRFVGSALRASRGGIEAAFRIAVEREWTAAGWISREDGGHASRLAGRIYDPTGSVPPGFETNREGKTFTNRSHF